MGNDPRIKRFQEIFEPERLKQVMAEVGLFLISYESLKAYIIDHARDFFADEIPPLGEPSPVSDSFRTRVMSRDKNLLRACLLWLQEMKVVTDADIAKVFEIRDYRNSLAHELGGKLLTHGWSVDKPLLESVIALIDKIGKFWGQIAVDVDPAFDGKEIDYEGITPAAFLLLQFMRELVVKGEESGV